MAGGQKRRVERSEAFLKLAARIVTFPGGDFEPSPPPQLLSKLTDEDLVLAVDAVEAVAAKQQQRLIRKGCDLSCPGNSNVANSPGPNTVANCC